MNLKVKKGYNGQRNLFKNNSIKDYFQKINFWFFHGDKKINNDDGDDDSLEKHFTYKDTFDLLKEINDKIDKLRKYDKKWARKGKKHEDNKRFKYWC